MKKLLMVLALWSVGCGARSFNPKATMCLDPNFTPEQDSEIMAAAQEWHDVTNGEVDFQFQVGSGCELDIKDAAGLRFNGEIAMGETDDSFQWIKLNTSDRWVNPKTGSISYAYQYSLREVALHELGHYLTGSEHSPNREDIMYTYVLKHITDAGFYNNDRHLSQADIDRWVGKNHSYNDEADHYPAE